MRIGIALTVFVALFLAAGPALADTDRGQTGNVGPFDINDRPDNPVVCHYDTVFLRAIESPAPSNWARDTTPGRDMRKVGWQTLLEKYDGSSWPIVYRSTIHTEWAWDDQAAAFAPRQISTKRYPLGDDHAGYYRVIQKMYWYGADGHTVVGKAKHESNYYVMEGFGPNDNCIGVVS
jgi:hypothetical protein